MTESAIETTDPLLAFILTLLTPLLPTATQDDAQRAAQQAIAAYQANGHHQLITIAQIVGFALISLDNLRLSMQPDLSLSMKLKLRGNANALNRSAQRSTATLEKQRLLAQDQPDDSLTETETETAAELEQASIDLPPPNPAEPPQPEQNPRQIWATAMTDIAAECSRNLANLKPAQRRAEMIRIRALTDTARHLHQPVSRSSPLSTTTHGTL